MVFIVLISLPLPCPVFLVKLLSNNDQPQVAVVKGDAAIEEDEEGGGTLALLMIIPFI